MDLSSIAHPQCAKRKYAIQDGGDQDSSDDDDEAIEVTGHDTYVGHCGRICSTALDTSGCNVHISFTDESMYENVCQDDHDIQRGTNNTPDHRNEASAGIYLATIKHKANTNRNVSLSLDLCKPDERVSDRHSMEQIVTTPEYLMGHKFLPSPWLHQLSETQNLFDAIYYSDAMNDESCIDMNAKNQNVCPSFDLFDEQGNIHLDFGEND